MPAFHHARIRGGHIELAEFDELRVVGSQNFHQAPALIGNHLELLDTNAVDHRFPFAFRDFFAVLAPFTLFAPPFATRLFASRRESNVPASVHQPSRTLWRIEPSPM